MKKLFFLNLLSCLSSFGILAQPLADFSMSVTEGCAPLEVQFIQEATPPGEIVSWEWSYNGMTVNEPNPLIVFDTAGVYEVCLEVMDINGFSASHCFNGITVFDDPQVTAAVQSEGCNGEPIGAIDLTVVQGEAPFTYIWSNGATTEDIMDLSAGTYSVLLEDANSCSANYSFQVPGISMNISGTVVHGYCSDTTSGSICLLVTGGSSPYEYLWSNTLTTSCAEDLVPGSYEVTITDENGCTAVENFIIADFPEITLLPEVTTLLCPGTLACIDLSNISGGCPAYAYFWDDGSTEALRCNLSEGTYEVTITDCNGCTITETFNISAPDSIQIQFSTTCEVAGQSNGSITPIVSGGTAPYLYQWSNGENTETISNLIADTYSLTVTDANGCTASASAETNDIIVSLRDTVNCDGDIMFFTTAPTAVSYDWTPAAMMNDPTIANPIAMITETTIFTLNVSNAAGCEDSESVTVSPGNIPFYVEAINPSCGNDNGDIFLHLNCGFIDDYTYEWEPNVSTIYNAENLAPGTYTVTVTDLNGNTETTVISLEDVDLEVDLTGPSEVCVGGSFNIHADIAPFNYISNTYTYQWEGPGVFTGNGSSSIFSSSADTTNYGCYTVTVTDAFGCTVVGAHCLIVELEGDNISGTSSNGLICEGESYQMEVLTIEAPQNYTYEWSPALSLNDPTIPNPIATPLSATFYQVTVTNIMTGCIETESVNVYVDDDCVWPGDTDTNNIVNNFDLINIGLGYDSTLNVRPNATLDWIAQPHYFASLPLPGMTVNRNHVDCNGDGIINDDDSEAITQNWGLEHNFAGGNDTEFWVPNYPQSSSSLTVPFYVDPDTLIEGESYSLAIILGEANDPAENVYGLAFSLEYDTTVVVAGSASIGFEGWIGELDDDMISVQKTFVSPGRIDVGITRTDHQGMTGFGEMGQLFITIEDDILFGHGQGGESRAGAEALFNITNYLVINNLGEEIPVIASETSAPVDGGTVGTQEVNWKKYLQVAPNPSNQAFQVTAKNIEIENLKLFSIRGELVTQLVPDASETTVRTSGLAPGTYLLKVQTELGVYVEKVMVVR